MARARNIKPGFFRNEDLADLDPLTRLLFAGLWTVADRAGRLEDRPRRIKADILPYDDSADIDAMLTALAERSFIARYKHGAAQYIQIINFDKHQNPHKNEAESAIPPMGEGEPITPEPPEEPVREVAENPAESGETGAHGTSTVQAPDQHSTNRADSLNSDSHDSGLLDSDGADAPAAPKPRRSSGKTPVPENFDPMADDKLAAWIRDKKYEPYIAVEVPKFLANHQARDSRMKDWNAAFRYWLTNGDSQGWLGRKPASITQFQNTPRNKHGGWSAQDYADLAVELERQGQ